MSGLTGAERQALWHALQKAEAEVNRGWGGAYGVVFRAVEHIITARALPHPSTDPDG